MIASMVRTAQFCHVNGFCCSIVQLQADDSRERALDDMMDGVLEVKKEDILKMVTIKTFF